MYNNLIIWLENNQQSCFYRQNFGIYCPGCGLQTAFISFLKCNFYESFLAYPALIPLIFTFSFLFFYILTKKEIIFKIVKYLLFSDLILILCNYLIKIILF